MGKGLIQRKHRRLSGTSSTEILTTEDTDIKLYLPVLEVVEERSVPSPPRNTSQDDNDDIQPVYGISYVKDKVIYRTTNGDVSGIPHNGSGGNIESKDEFRWYDRDQSLEDDEEYVPEND